MKTWKHPYYHSAKETMSYGDEICFTCGWMYQDHTYSTWVEVSKTEMGYVCPNSPTMPGYPKPTICDQSAAYYWGALGEEQNKALRKEYEQLKHNFEFLQHSTQEAYRLNASLGDDVKKKNDRIEELEKQFNQEIFKSMSHSNDLFELTAQKEELERISLEDSKIIIDLREENRNYFKQNQELKKESQEWRDRSYERSEEIRNLKAQLDDILKSKTISVHNYYCGKSKKSEPCNCHSQVDWMPISSAPKDGRLMLLSGATWVRVGMWNTNLNEWSTPYQTTQLDPAFWALLPDVPK